MLYERLRKEDRIIDNDWSNYTTSSVVYRPKKMTPEKLLDGYYDAYRGAFTYSSIFKRLWGNGTYKNFFWPMNFGFKQSIEKSVERLKAMENSSLRNS